jgi:glycosyltransferase involved in cell wall biosynthesis
MPASISFAARHAEMCYLLVVSTPRIHLFVVIPVYNEQATLHTLLSRVMQTTPPDDTERTILLVDDGSTDDTPAIIKAHADRGDIRICIHEHNTGKGAALRTGFKAALDAGADLILIQDGDLEYAPSDHAVVLAPLLDGRADVVIGTRFKGQASRVLYFWHSVANRGITLLSNMLTNLNLSDIECCFKAFTREVAQELTIRENRFGVEPEIVAKVAHMRLQDHAGTRHARVFEVPISYAGRTYAEGKKIGWRDGFAALWCIVKYNMFV